MGGLATKHGGLTHLQPVDFKAHMEELIGDG
jgi:hypothetical protein